jgi:hypothetical protein
MEMAGKHSDHYFCRWQEKKIVTTINICIEKNQTNEKCLKLPDFARKLDRKIFWKFYPPEFSGVNKQKRKVLRIL